MKTLSLLKSLLFAALALGCSLPQAQAQIEVRASFKILLDTNNAPPPASGGFATDANIRARVDQANRLLTSFGRGYTFRVTEVTNLAGHADLLDTDCKETTAQIEAGVQTNPASYAWRTTAMNVYITRGNDVGGACAFNSMLVLHWNDIYNTLCHEGGHHLGLAHTQGAGCGGCDTCTNLMSDFIGDTLPDRECWSFNQIAANAFPATYPNLTTAQTAMVSNTFNNVMSYHRSDGGTATVLTPDQWDHLADFTRTNRMNIMNGKTLFVDNTTPACAARDGFSECFGAGVGGPFLTVAQGITRASAGDIVLIRPGHYNEPMTITKAVALRATRGDALIGKP